VRVVAENFGKDRPMRLNEAQLKQTLNQMDAEVLPDTHPAAAQLTDLFGDHTFLLDHSGLKVLEPSEMSADEVQTSQVVSLADWSDATLTSLKPHAPEPTGTVVVFDQTKH
jgi:predicted TIM-barrel fold metal-dependent hydrolase